MTPKKPYPDANMELSCGAKCAKGLLVTFNLFFWISGCFLLGVGIYMLVDKDKALLFHLLLTPGHNYALGQLLAWAMIVIGGVVFFVGFCGCCGAIREHRMLLVVYFLFLFLIMGAELAIGILSVIFQDKTLEKLQNLHGVLREQYGINSQTTEAIDYAQTKFNCCGIFTSEDYADSAWKTQNLGRGDLVAKTCCLLSNNDHLDPKPLNSTWCQSIKSTENLQYRHPEGCFYKLEEFVRSTNTLFVSVGCGMAVLQLFGMFFAMCLCKEV